MASAPERPLVGGLRFTRLADYELRMQAIRRESPLGTPLEGDDYYYAIDYLSYNYEWGSNIIEHGGVEAITIEINTDVPPYRDSRDQHQAWVHYEDGEAEVFSCKRDRGWLGAKHGKEESLFALKLQRLRVAARCVIRPLCEQLKRESGLSGRLDVHHAGKSFEQLLYDFLVIEKRFASIDDLGVVDIGDAGQKTFEPLSLAGEWFEYHKAESTLRVMTKEDHMAWHSAHGKDSSPDWRCLDRPRTRYWSMPIAEILAGAT